MARALGLLDPAVGLLIAAVAVKEGVEPWRGEGCCVGSPLDGYAAGDYSTGILVTRPRGFEPLTFGSVDTARCRRKMPRIRRRGHSRVASGREAMRDIAREASLRVDAQAAVVVALGGGAAGARGPSRDARRAGSRRCGRRARAAGVARRGGGRRQDGARPCVRRAAPVGRGAGRGVRGAVHAAAARAAARHRRRGRRRAGGADRARRLRRRGARGAGARAARRVDRRPGGSALGRRGDARLSCTCSAGGWRGCRRW